MMDGTSIMCYNLTIYVKLSVFDRYIYFLFNIGWHGVLWILLGVSGESGESGARPASGISIEFEIQSKFAALWV